MVMKADANIYLVTSTQLSTYCVLCIVNAKTVNKGI